MCGIRMRERRLEAETVACLVAELAELAVWDELRSRAVDFEKCDVW